MLETVPTLGGVFSIGRAKAVEARRAVARMAFQDNIAAVSNSPSKLVCLGTIKGKGFEVRLENGSRARPEET